MIPPRHSLYAAFPAAAPLRLGLGAIGAALAGLRQPGLVQDPWLGRLAGLSVLYTLVPCALKLAALRIFAGRRTEKAVA